RRRLRPCRTITWSSARRTRTGISDPRGKTRAGAGRPTYNSQMAPPAGRSLRPPATRSAMTHGRILVVDDDESVLRFLATLLTALGHEVACAESGEQALKRLEETPRPGLVLLDLIMPGMGGLELLDRIRDSQPSLPVIVLSTE